MPALPTAILPCGSDEELVSAYCCVSGTAAKSSIGMTE